MNAFKRIAQEVSEPFEIPYTYLILLGVGTLVFWGLEWGLNMIGYGSVNIFTTILTDVLILIIGMKPLYVAYSGQIGAILSAVNLTDPRKGVPNAVRIHFKVVLWLIFVNSLVGLTLGNIPFGAPFSGTGVVFFNLLLLIATAVNFSYLFELPGVDLKKRFIIGFMILVLVIIGWSYLGPNRQEDVISGASSAVSSLSLGSSCSDAAPVVSAGARLTLTADCPAKIDQRRMAATGVDFVLVDPALRATTGRSQLVSFDQEPGSHVLTLVPNKGGFERLGLTSVEVEIYPRGTGERRVAERHGVASTTTIDLTPAR